MAGQTLAALEEQSHQAGSAAFLSAFLKLHESKLSAFLQLHEFSLRNMTHPRFSRHMSQDM